MNGFSIINSDELENEIAELYALECGSVIEE
jgi:hypothetical protein